jgi:hypothetical protein
MLEDARAGPVRKKTAQPERAGAGKVQPAPKASLATHLSVSVRLQVGIHYVPKSYWASDFSQTLPSKINSAKCRDIAFEAHSFLETLHFGYEDILTHYDSPF